MKWFKQRIRVKRQPHQFGMLPCYTVFNDFDCVRVQQLPMGWSVSRVCGMASIPLLIRLRKRDALNAARHALASR